MRPIPQALAARAAGETTTLAHVWRLTRADGLRLMFTDHDASLPFEGAIADPAHGLAGARFERSFDLAPDTGSALGAIAADALAAEDFAAGLWDDAKVEVFLLDWTSPEAAVSVFVGRLGEVRHGAQGFEAELRGLKDALAAPAGRVFSRRCDAVLGDARCGVDLQAHPGAQCDKRFATCRDRFANAANFRGFPHMPGADALLRVGEAAARAPAVEAAQ